MTPEMIAAMLRVAFKDGTEAGFYWAKGSLSEADQHELYESWAEAKAEEGAKEAAGDCGCFDGAESICVNVLCPRK